MKKINKRVKEEIITYCRAIIKQLDLDYLKKNNVNQNEFLEFLYLTSVEHYKNSGVYELSKEEVSLIFSFKKITEENLKRIREQKVEILGIDKEDNLIIPNDKNEISNRRAVESGKDGESI